jgi:putative membrane protein
MRLLVGSDLGRKHPVSEAMRDNPIGGRKPVRPDRGDETVWRLGWGFGPAGALFGLLIWVLFVGLLIALIVRLVRGPRRRYWMQGPHPDDPEQVLRTRFARGEISADEFKQRLDVLRRTSGPPRT